MTARHHLCPHYSAITSCGVLSRCSVLTRGNEFMKSSEEERGIRQAAIFVAFHQIRCSCWRLRSKRPNPPGIGHDKSWSPCLELRPAAYGIISIDFGRSPIAQILYTVLHLLGGFHCYQCQYSPNSLSNGVTLLGSQDDSGVRLAAR